VIRIRHREFQRVAEDRCRFDELNPVLAPVRGIFGGRPLEVHLLACRSDFSSHGKSQSIGASRTAMMEG
jgi:hypothetical protein